MKKSVSLFLDEVEEREDKLVSNSFDKIVETYKKNGIIQVPERKFWVKEDIKLLVNVGCLIRARADMIFEVKDSEGSLYKAYRLEDDAKEEAEKINGSYRSIEVELKNSPEEFIKKIIEKDYSKGMRIKQIAQFISQEERIYNFETLDFPENLNDKDSRLSAYSVILGFLMENDYPEIYIVSDSFGIKRAVHGKRENLEKEGKVKNMKKDGENLES